MDDSRTIRFVERQEEKRKPHPGIYTFVAVLWGAIAVTTLVGFIAFRSENGGDDWSLLILAIGATVVHSWSGGSSVTGGARPPG